MHNEAASLSVSWCARMLMHSKQRNGQTLRPKNGPNSTNLVDSQRSSAIVRRSGSVATGASYRYSSMLKL
jgi:hypothetical protein